MGLELFGITMIYSTKQVLLEIDTNKTTEPLTGSKEVVFSPKEVVFSPKTKDKMRKIKSEENFVKFQVPWIL